MLAVRETRGRLLMPVKNVSIVAGKKFSTGKTQTAPGSVCTQEALNI